MTKRKAEKFNHREHREKSSQRTQKILLLWNEKFPFFEGAGVV